MNSLVFTINFSCYEQFFMRVKFSLTFQQEITLGHHNSIGLFNSSITRTQLNALLMCEMWNHWEKFLTVQNLVFLQCFIDKETIVNWKNCAKNITGCLVFKSHFQPIRNIFSFYCVICGKFVYIRSCNPLICGWLI